MTNAVPNFLEGPTYISIRRYPDGETWLDETKLNTSLEQAVEDIDNLHQVVMLEGGKAVDVSDEAAELWFNLHGNDQCDTTFDVPEFIHDNYRDAYSRICESRYQANAEFAHVNSLAGRLG